MAIWAEIKKAINSTLGTANFRPLNEIVMQTKDLAADDRVYKIIYPTGTTTINNVDFTANRNGSIRILLPVTRNSHASRTNTYRIRAKQGNTVIVDYQETIAAGADAKIIHADMQITHGTTYTIIVTESDNGSSLPNGLMLGAVELDVTGITIE